jgi:hypothetical protein
MTWRVITANGIVKADVPTRGQAVAVARGMSMLYLVDGMNKTVYQIADKDRADTLVFVSGQIEANRATPTRQTWVMK